MTTREMAALIGQTGAYRATPELSFEVRILDVRQRYGDTDVLIEPVSGAGQKWTPLYKVETRS